MELFWEKLKTLDKVCGKLILRKLGTDLRKLVIRDTTQLEQDYKTSSSQLARESRVNLKIHENAISNQFSEKKNRFSVCVWLAEMSG